MNNKKMNREEWKAWAMALKPGDRVILKVWAEVKVAIVKNVTPSGRVNTNQGVFYQDSCWEHYRGYGKTNGTIEPATPELIAEAEKQKLERQERQRKASVIREAEQFARRLTCGYRISYEMAEELIALAKKYEEKSN